MGVEALLPACTGGSFYMKSIASFTRPKSIVTIACAVALALGIQQAWQRPGAAQEQRVSNGEAKEHARGLSRAFRKAAESTIPTVVTIESRTKEKVVSNGSRGRRRGENPFKGTPFEDFFNDPDSPFGRQFFGDEDGPRSFTPRREGTGSGVIID